MSISKDRRRKKPFIAWSSSGTYKLGSVPTISIITIIALTTLLICDGFVLIISPALMASALAQEEVTATTTITGAGETTTDTTTTEASPPPPGIEFSPQTDQNFSEFPEFDEFFSQSEDFASPSTSSFMTEVNGTYTNPNIGFQVDLPAGWKGIEINFLVNSVFAVPGETDLELLTQQGAGTGDAFQEPATFMTIVGIDQESFDMLESVVSQLPALGEGGGDGGQAGVGGQEEILPQDSSNPLGTSPTPFGDNAVSCTYLQPSFVTINGINAEERVGECTDGVGANPKTKSYTFATQDNSLIVLGFYANSTSTYDQNLPLFEESVITISISRPADIATSEIYSRYNQLVEMQQQQQQLSNQTSGGM